MGSYCSRGSSWRAWRAERDYSSRLVCYLLRLCLPSPTLASCFPGKAIGKDEAALLPSGIFFMKPLAESDVGFSLQILVPELRTCSPSTQSRQRCVTRRMYGAGPISILKPMNEATTQGYTRSCRGSTDVNEGKRRLGLVNFDALGRCPR